MTDPTTEALIAAAQSLRAALRALTSIPSMFDVEAGPIGATVLVSDAEDRTSGESYAVGGHVVVDADMVNEGLLLESEDALLAAVAERFGVRLWWNEQSWSKRRHEWTRYFRIAGAKRGPWLARGD